MKAKNPGKAGLNLTADGIFVSLENDWEGYYHKGKSSGKLLAREYYHGLSEIECIR